MIKVKILAYTPNPEKVIAMAARQTRLSQSVSEEMDEKQVYKLIDSLLRKKHLSPFEHVSFTFLISGISRVCSHQLVRHRIASYSQKSQRFVKISKESFIIPPSIRNNREALNTFNRVLSKAVEGYDKLISRNPS